MTTRMLRETSGVRCRSRRLVRGWIRDGGLAAFSGVARSGRALDQIMLVNKSGKVTILILLIRDMCMQDMLLEDPRIVEKSQRCTQGMPMGR